MKTPHPSKTTRHPAHLALAALLTASVLTGLAPAAQAQSPCSQSGYNMQCSELGTVRMQSVREIKGQPIQVTAEVTLASNFKEHGARWFLFSVRNVTDDGSDPIMVQVDSFQTADGAAIVTNKVDRHSYETDFWVDAEDVPVGKAIQIAMTIGAGDTGAFNLETLVMAFDRGYSPCTDSTGNQASLFAFTLLGVKDKTGHIGAGPLSKGYTVPAPGALASLMAVGAVALLARRRQA